MEGFGDPSVVGGRVAEQGGGAAVAREHADSFVGADGSGVDGDADPQDVLLEWCFRWITS
ncbi:hypothetical protein GCM10015535_64840 [Streptomyces gelaticus]|uniref:Uncharacterized protein n=1 Tax=Streptomyces gelaticus TaxID=285446 RepID=A0ABQ2WBU2_9ACTN|nr:hypothetical protein GCM10015535_64840 [Streptomyces gelaticus]